MPANQSFDQPVRRPFGNSERWTKSGVHTWAPMSPPVGVLVFRRLPRPQRQTCNQSLMPCHSVFGPDVSVRCASLGSTNPPSFQNKMSVPTASTRKPALTPASACRTRLTVTPGDVRNRVTTRRVSVRRDGFSTGPEAMRSIGANGPGPR